MRAVQLFKDEPLHSFAFICQCRTSTRLIGCVSDIVDVNRKRVVLLRATHPVLMKLVQYFRTLSLKALSPRE